MIGRIGNWQKIDLDGYDVRKVGRRLLEPT